MVAKRKNRASKREDARLAEQSAKGQRRLKAHKAPSSTCGHRGRVVVVPVVAKPVAEPVPPAAAPVEETDIEVATGVAVDGAPEEDVAGVTLLILLPLLGNEVRIGVEVVEDVGVEDGLLRQLLAELVAFDDLATLLAVREEELDTLGVELPLAALLVLLDLPAVGQEGVGIAVDDMFKHCLFPCQDFKELKDIILHTNTVCQ